MKAFTISLEAATAEAGLTQNAPLNPGRDILPQIALDVVPMNPSVAPGHISTGTAPRSTDQDWSTVLGYNSGK